MIRCKPVGIALLLLVPLMALSQKTTIVDSSQPGFRTVIAGKEYEASKSHKWLWGVHYRKEWVTPVKVPVINLDTVAGGLTPILQGGGRQTKTLRLKDRNGQQYVLRSIDKDYSAALPDIVLGTFIQNLARDVTSTIHPFASVTVPQMIEAAGVYHTNPIIVFVPYTPSLGKFNDEFANTLCLFEERANDNEEDSPNFGYAEDVKGTPRLLEKMINENDHQVDQKSYVRARLFDMFLGDWGRHEDQWRWAEFDSGDYKIYRPIPRDRDQSYTRFTGFLLKKIMSTGQTQYIQDFDDKIKNIKTYNFPARNLDRRMANNMPKVVWTETAKELQAALTDQVIEQSIKQLPPELFPISGEVIIHNLKTRRNDLVTYAEEYYDFIAEAVDVVGTKKDEMFVIERINDKETRVEVYDLNKEKIPKPVPFYSRTFNDDETKEVRVYGISGNDIYRIQGDASNDIKVRIIGGTNRDSLITEAPPGKMIYYDNRGNIVQGKIRTKTSNDSSINFYDYGGFQYNSGDFILSPYYTNTRGIHAYLGYAYTKQMFRKQPFGWRQMLRGNYSFSNKSFGADYEAMFTELIGKWSVLINGSFDQRLQYYYFGQGNDTKFTVDKFYHQWFSEELQAGTGLSRLLGKHHYIYLGAQYQKVTVEKNPDTYLFAELLPANGKSYESKDFLGGLFTYRYHNYNDEIVPTKGFEFLGTGQFLVNMKDKDRKVNKLDGILGFYIPFSRVISLASRTGASVVNGEPEFYQLAWIGGGRSLRGYIRQRFFGESSVYNNNDLRFIFNTRNRLFNGKIGLIAFFDHGRVWMNDDKSNTWHMGYGGGLMLVPFNKMSVTGYWGFSEDGNRIHIRFGRLF